jgi:aminoglycoside/choline kinase family phosphotransferase
VQSPNLFWLAARDGIRRVGLIDFQDMFAGPAAYDVVSLCQDARVTIPAALETRLRDQYVDLRQGALDLTAFDEAYAILGTARAMKNMGVFARLADHVGKSHYLQHLPRMRDYLARNLSHAVLSELSLWYERHLPSESQAAK